MTNVRTKSEVAIRRLNALAGFFTEASRDTQRGPHRFRKRARRLGRLSQPYEPRLRVSSHDKNRRSRTLNEVTLVRAVSILEAFVIDLGEEEILSRLAAADKLPSLKSLTDYLFHAHWDRISGIGGWAQAVEVWKEGLGLNPKEFERWEEVDLLRTTRHSIVHRLGEITSKYRKSNLVRKRLKALGIDADQVTGLIPLDQQDVYSGIELCHEFVRWLDFELTK